MQLMALETMLEKLCVTGADGKHLVKTLTKLCVLDCMAKINRQRSIKWFSILVVKFLDAHKTIFKRTSAVY